VRTTRHVELNRCDVPGDLSSLVGKGDTGNPLGARAFEAYQFDRNPAEIGLSVAPVAPRLTAEVQTVFSLSEYARKLETRIIYHVQDRPIFRLRVALPDDFRLDHLYVPYDHQYVLTDSQNRRWLTIFLAAGHAGDFDVIINGTLRRADGTRATADGTRSVPATAGGLDQVAVPRVEVLDAGSQPGSSRKISHWPGRRSTTGKATMPPR
jgi:hypothetical protein